MGGILLLEQYALTKNACGFDVKYCVDIVRNKLTGQEKFVCVGNGEFV